LIRLRLIAWNAVIFAATLSLIGTVVFLTSRAELYRGVDEDLTKRALYLEQTWMQPADGRIGGNHESPPIPPPSMSAARQLDPIQARRVEFIAHLAMPRIFSSDGTSIGRGVDRPLDRIALSQGFASTRVFTTLEVDDHRVRVLTVPLRHAGRAPEAAQFATDLEGVDSAISRLGAVLLTTLPLALAATCLLGYSLTNRALRPVRDIAEASEEIEAINLSGRLPVVGNDEFAYLAGRFNSMLGRLEESFHRLAQTNESQRRFIADASHELKTPLTTVKGRVGVALLGPQTVERYADHIHAIGRAADGMSAIVSDLLLLAQSDEGKLILKREPARLSELAREACVLANPSEPDRVEIDVPSSLLVCVDSNLVERALSNLIANATRHTPLPGTIAIRGTLRGNTVKIEVKDQGDGIPAEHIPRLFDRFHRVDSSRDRESGGTGLGLSIVRSIVEAHDGSIEIASEVGVGTTVSLFLPQPAR